jgi:hypothetical protein
MTNSEELARKVSNLARQGDSSNSKRNMQKGGGYRTPGKQHRAKEATN